MVDHLLSLLGGIHFRELNLAWYRGREGSYSATALISVRTPTLENLHLYPWSTRLDPTSVGYGGSLH